MLLPIQSQQRLPQALQLPHPRRKEKETAREEAAHKPGCDANSWQSSMTELERISCLVGLHQPTWQGEHTGQMISCSAATVLFLLLSLASPPFCLSSALRPSPCLPPFIASIHLLEVSWPFWRVQIHPQTVPGEVKIHPWRVPGGSWRPLGSSGGLLGAFAGSWRAPGAGLEASWAQRAPNVGALF